MGLVIENLTVGGEENVHETILKVATDAEADVGYTSQTEIVAIVILERLDSLAEDGLLLIRLQETEELDEWSYFLLFRYFFLTLMTVGSRSS